MNNEQLWNYIVNAYYAPNSAWADITSRGEIPEKFVRKCVDDVSTKYGLNEDFCYECLCRQLGIEQ